MARVWDVVGCVTSHMLYHTLRAWRLAYIKVLTRIRTTRTVTTIAKCS